MPLQILMGNFAWLFHSERYYQQSGLITRVILWMFVAINIHSLITRHIGCPYLNHRRINMEWISVKDRLPQEGVRSIFYSEETKRMSIGNITLADEPQDIMITIDCNFFDTRLYISYFTHWTVLPTPPKD